MIIYNVFLSILTIFHIHKPSLNIGRKHCDTVQIDARGLLAKRLKDVDGLQNLQRFLNRDDRCLGVCSIITLKKYDKTAPASDKL